MALKNPLVIAFAKSLQSAYRAGQITQNGRPISQAQWSGLYTSMFRETMDPNARKDRIVFVMRRWKHEFRVSFPPTVWNAFKDLFHKLHNKTLGDEILEGVIAVTDNPAFKAVIGVATAAIPGVGAVLAPLAVALETAVTNTVKKAHEGNLQAGDVLSNVASVAASSAPALSAASPAIGQAIQAGRTTYDKISATSRTVLAAARAVATPEARQMTAHLTAARGLILRAKHGDEKANLQIRTISRRAQSGDRASIQALAYIHATALGMAQGYVPHATKEERHAFRLKRPLPRHLKYLAAVSGGHPFRLGLPKTHAAPGSPLAYEAHGTDTDDGSANYGSEASESEYNEASEGYDNTESGSYDAASDAEATETVDVTDGACDCRTEDVGALAIRPFALPKTQPHRAQPKPFALPKTAPRAAPRPGAPFALPKTSPALRAPTTPNVLSGSQLALLRRAQPTIAPAIAMSSPASPAFPGAPYAGPQYSGPATPAQGGYGYGMPGASDQDEGAASEPGTYGEPGSYDDEDRDESGWSDDSDWAAE